MSRIGCRRSLFIAIVGVCGLLQLDLIGEDEKGPPKAELPLGLEGYCPVSLITDRAWRKGSSDCESVYEGHKYWCANQDALKRFLKQPERFAPAFAGYDVVEYLDNMRRVPGDRRHGVFYRGAVKERSSVFLFVDEKNLARFGEAPKHYLELLLRVLALAADNIN